MTLRTAEVLKRRGMNNAWGLGWLGPSMSTVTSSTDNEYS